MTKYRYKKTLYQTMIQVREMDRDELLELINSLYGTGELQRKFSWPDDEDVREEAIRQVYKDFDERHTGQGVNHAQEK